MKGLSVSPWALCSNGFRASMEGSRHITHTRTRVHTHTHTHTHTPWWTLDRCNSHQRQSLAVMKPQQWLPLRNVPHGRYDDHPARQVKYRGNTCTTECTCTCSGRGPSVVWLTITLTKSPYSKDWTASFESKNGSYRQGIIETRMKMARMGTFG